MSTDLHALRRENTLLELRAELMAAGLDPIYARGLVADPATVAHLAFTEDGATGASLSAVARELAEKAPRHAFRPESQESPEAWALRTFGGKDAAAEYLSRYNQRPAQRRERGDG